MSKRQTLLSLMLALFFPIPAGTSFAQEIDLKHWTAPLYWSPAAPSREPSEGTSARRSFRIAPGATAAVTTNPLPFISMNPCRQYDSRSDAVLVQNNPRTVTLIGSPCGIPSNAEAVAVNITVFNITGAGGNGVFKVGAVSPPTTAWINYPPTETQRANAGVLPLGAAGTIVVQVNQGAGSVDFVVDVFGYYSPPAAYAHLFAFGTVSSVGNRDTFFSNFGTWTASRFSEGNYSVLFPGLRPGCAGSWPMMVVSASGFVARIVSGAGSVTNCGTGDVSMSVSSTNAADVAADSPFSFSAFREAPALGFGTPATRGWIPSTCTLDASTGTETCE